MNEPLLHPEAEASHHWIIGEISQGLPWHGRHVRPFIKHDKHGKRNPSLGIGGNKITPGKKCAWRLKRACGNACQAVRYVLFLVLGCSYISVSFVMICLFHPYVLYCLWKEVNTNSTSWRLSQEQFQQYQRGRSRPRQESLEGKKEHFPGKFAVRKTERQESLL